MKKIIIGLVHVYQKIPGPWHSMCRHIPTCSNYMIESVNIHGSVKGLYLGTKRILKCNPFGTPGIDLVPKKKEGIK